MPELSGALEHVPPDHLAPLAFTLDAIGRTGARSSTFGYLEDDPPSRWWASATFEGTKVQVDRQPTALSAVMALYGILASGAECPFCNRQVALLYGSGPSAELTVAARMRDGQFETVRVPVSEKRRWCVRRCEPTGWSTCRRVRHT